MLNEGISIIIVNWNTKDVTDECLADIKKTIDEGKLNVEVIVVDNGSTDGSSGMILRKYPWVNLVTSKENLGFAKGNNLGFKKTNPKNKYLLLLNSDAFIRKDTFIKSIKYFEENNKCDVLGCKLENKDGRLQPSAGFLPTPLTVSLWMIGLNRFGVHPKNKDFFEKSREVGWITGAFVFMKREVFEKTRGFDEKFFMYMDEVEWCKRAKNLGYHIFYTPGFSVTHLDKASAQGLPENLIRVYGLEILGLKYYLRKYYHDHLIYLLPIIRLGILTRLIAFKFLGRELRQKAYSQILKEI
jgi:GT2 family glycosyltransferase